MVDEPSSPARTEDEEGEYYLVEGYGLAHAWKRFARLFQLPVIAWGGRRIYWVKVRGDGFFLPIEGGRPVIGFYTHRHVAARDVEEAEAEARRLVWKDWQGIGGPGAHTLDPAAPVLWMEETVELEERFLRRAGGGYTYYSSED